MKLPFELELEGTFSLLLPEQMTYQTKLVCKCNANIISYPAVVPSPERGKVIMTKLVYKS